MPRTITKIEKVQDDSTGNWQLLYTYSDGSSVKFRIHKDDGGEYIDDKNADGGDIKRYIITQEYLVASKVKDADFNFKYHVFLLSINFFGMAKKYAKKLSFNEAHFNQGCFFKGVELLGEVDFSYACFLGVANFSEIRFPKGANFYGAQFSDKVYFEKSTFVGVAKFSRACFLDAVFFGGAKFKKLAGFDNAQFFSDVTWGTDVTFADEANFAKVLFSNQALFGDTEFSQLVNFEFANIKELLVLSKTTKEIKLLAVNLKGAVVNNIDYTNVEFAPENRETAMVLKGIAIKQYDQVAALKFQRQEMDVYLKELKDKGLGFRKMHCLRWLYLKVVKFFRKFFGLKNKSKSADACILQIEKRVSDFGTNPLQAVSWLAVWNAAFFGVAWWIKGCLPDSPLDAMDELGLLQIIYHPINVFLIYEFVKSLRKFSRRL